MLMKYAANASLDLLVSEFESIRSMVFNIHGLEFCFYHGNDIIGGLLRRISNFFSRCLNFA